jgi:DNA-binding response OmpR family regulator
MHMGKNILLYEPSAPLHAVLAEALAAAGFTVTAVTKMPTVLPADTWLVAGGPDPLAITALLRERMGDSKGESAPCFHLLPAGEGSGGTAFGIEKPFRLQECIQQLAYLAGRPRDVMIGRHKLHVNIRQLQFADARTVALTEKEVAILLYLAEAVSAGKAGVPRDELLHQVWGYHPDATTHTLETHIYRLRQKIEIDPENPSLLVTKDEGYCLA